MCSKESQAKRSEYRIDNNCRNRRKFVKPTERSSGSEAILSEVKIVEKFMQMGASCVCRRILKRRLWSLWKQASEKTPLWITPSSRQSVIVNFIWRRPATACESSIRLINIQRIPVVSSSHKYDPSRRRWRKRLSLPQLAPVKASPPANHGFSQTLDRQ